MAKRTMQEMWATVVVAGTIGLAAWTVTMASAPRHDSSTHPDMGDPIYYPVLLGTALVGGFLVPRRAEVFGLMLGLPGLVLAPWTAPRGDDDGLWLLIVPILAVFLAVLVATAVVAAWTRTLLTRLIRR